MNKIVGLSLLCILFFSCKKESQNSGLQNPKNDTLKFEVLGLNDTMMEQTDTVAFNVEVKYLSGIKDWVTLSIDNLPITMTAGFYPQIDTPSFFSEIRVVARDADTGIYNIKITASGSKFSKDYYVQLKVKPTPINPAAMLAGQYSESGACSISQTVNDTVSVSIVTPLYNKIKLRGLWNGSSAINVLADVDPVMHTLSIPSQQVNGQIFSGSGNYTATEIDISYTVSDGFIFYDNCTTVLTKQ